MSKITDTGKRKAGKMLVDRRVLVKQKNICGMKNKWEDAGGVTETIGQARWRNVVAWRWFGAGNVGYFHFQLI